MNNLFKKAAVATDIHFGAKNNSTVHNEDCLSFIKWFIEKAKSSNCDTAIICGDYHNNRSSVNILTLNYIVKSLELLNHGFDNVYMILGNHDLYYKENRDVHSVEWASHLPNIHIVNNMMTEGNVTLCPWLVNDEYKKTKNIKSDYVFGHLELPHFYMNSMVILPEHGEFNHKWFSNCGQVYSGHFHKRQTRDNITYLGNAFPHNYGDAGDRDRGMMILEWGKEPEYHAWADQPTYNVFNLSNVLQHTDSLLVPHSYNRVIIDVEISYEEANFLKEQLVPQYNIREFSMVPKKSERLEESVQNDNLKFEGVDQLVTSAISNIESKNFDRQLLLEVYQNL